MPRPKSSEQRDRMIHVRLSENTHKQLRVKVAQEGATIQEWVNKLITKHLEPNRDKKA